MIGEVVLDFANADVHSTANDNVFGSAGHPHIAVVGHHAQIARSREALGGEQGSGFLGVGEVFDHVRGTAVGDVALGAAGNFVPFAIADRARRTGHGCAVGGQGARQVV